MSKSNIKANGQWPNYVISADQLWVLAANRAELAAAASNNWFKSSTTVYFTAAQTLVDGRVEMRGRRSCVLLG